VGRAADTAAGVAKEDRADSRVAVAVYSRAWDPAASSSDLDSKEVKEDSLGRASSLEPDRSEAAEGEVDVSHSFLQNY
jgi:hypothetical protein